MKTALVTFANTESKYHKCFDRIQDTGKDYFDKISLFTEHNLDAGFLHKNRLLYNMKRGYGYWSWKPYIILTTLAHMDAGDMCMYIDSGNDIISDPKPLFNLCEKEDGILLFNNRDGSPDGQIWKNSMWTKKDCFVFMHADEEKYVKGVQVDAAYQVYKKAPDVIKFLHNYMIWCQNIHVVSDEPNITFDNYDDFKDHRHDQSILSLLAIKHNINLYTQPSEWGNRNRDDNFGQIFHHHRGAMYG